MATLTIRNLDDDLKTRLRTRAAQNDHSMALRLLTHGAKWCSLDAACLTLVAQCAHS